VNLRDDVFGPFLDFFRLELQIYGLFITAVEVKMFFISLSFDYYGPMGKVLLKVMELRLHNTFKGFILYFYYYCKL